MNPRRKKRLSIALVIIIGLGSVTGLVLYALKQNIDLFYTPTQLIEGIGEDKVKPEIGQRFSYVFAYVSCPWFFLRVYRKPMEYDHITTNTMVLRI